MFPPTRQVKLNPVLEKLKAIPGVSFVQQDDFDSAGINVFISLQGISTGTGQHRFVPALGRQPVLTAKRAVARACKSAGVSFRFLDWPAMTYQWVSGAPGIRGHKVSDGYDGWAIKIEVLV
jgi:hypothetical protein